MASRYTFRMVYNYTGKRRPDPTPAEIQRRSAEVRARWSDEDHLKKDPMRAPPVEAQEVDGRLFLGKR